METNKHRSTTTLPILFTLPERFVHSSFTDYLENIYFLLMPNHVSEHYIPLLLDLTRNIGTNTLSLD